MFALLEFPAEQSTLEKVGATEKALAELGLRLSPPVNRGELDDIRRVVFTDDLPPNPQAILDQISSGENGSFELKSSLLFDHRKAAHVHLENPEAFRSEDVLHSNLKTIAGFLNSDGGSLVVGVDDNSAVLGIQFDYCCISKKQEHHNADRWEQSLRSFINSRFHDGGMVNNYVTCHIMRLNELEIAYIRVAPRKKLSFLLKEEKNGYCLYRRQGNRTVEVPIEQIEELIAVRGHTFE